MFSVSGSGFQKPLFHTQESEDEEEMLRRAITMSLGVQMDTGAEKEEENETQCFNCCLT